MKKFKRLVCPRCKKRVTNVQMEDGDGCNIVGGSVPKGKKQRWHDDCWKATERHLFRG